jgi:hypothetical protein
MSPNRIVALITPVCALGAGWAASWLAENVPGINVTEENLQAVFIAGALAVLAPALHWLNGWQKWEVRNEEALAVAARGFPDESPAVASAVVDEGAAAEDGELDLSLDEDHDEFDDLLDIDEFEDTSVADDEEPVPAGR